MASLLQVNHCKQEMWYCRNTLQNEIDNHKFNCPGSLFFTNNLSSRKSQMILPISTRKVLIQLRQKNYGSFAQKSAYIALKITWNLCVVMRHCPTCYGQDKCQRMKNHLHNWMLKRQNDLHRYVQQKHPHASQVLNITSIPFFSKKRRLLIKILFEPKIIPLSSGSRHSINSL